MASLRHTWSAFKANMQLGWNMEGNWVPPWVYIFIALLTPAAGVMILIFMYLVIMGDKGDANFLAFIMAGSAVFIFVRMTLQGTGWAVVEDREHYRVLRYIYLAPVPFPVQIFGRTTAKILVAIFGSTLMIICGHYFLHIPLRPDGV